MWTADVDVVRKAKTEDIRSERVALEMAVIGLEEETMKRKYCNKSENNVEHQGTLSGTL